MFIDPAILADAAELAAIRRDIHAHPELAFAESRTAEKVAVLLKSWGIDVVRGVGGTSVVGVLTRGRSGRAVGLRADMDALPIAEDNDFAHASRTPATMHACGHDGHTAMLLSAARHLARAGIFDGTVYFVFQPGEESGRGALRMIEDGLFERFPMEAIFGAHNWPNLPVGSFAVLPGPMMASCNEFTIEIVGRGGHAAMPDLAVDPVQPACQIATALQTIVSRNVAPHEAAVVSVTVLQAGGPLHVIPNVATLKGTVRTFSEATTGMIEGRIRAISDGISAAHGATCTVGFVRNCAPTVNHASEANFVAAVLAELGGENALRPFQPSMAAEDFSFMLQAKAGCYFMIGNGDGDHRGIAGGPGPCVLHNPSYDFNDDLIPIGAQAWSAIAETWLAKGSATRGQ